MKTVAHDRKVEDLGGLYYELVKRNFSVENVGADAKGTYVHLGDTEDKDPLPIVQEWVGRPVPPPTRKMYEERRAIEAALAGDRTKRAAEEQAKRAAEEKAKKEAAAAAAEAAEAAKPKPSLISKVFRKLW